MLYRQENGEPVVLENRCPHRNLPLSEGRLIGDEIECGYHGLVFNCDGACTHQPGAAEPPSWAAVRKYPVAERNGWVFFWPGDPAQADQAPVPDYTAVSYADDWIRVEGQTHVKAGYRLILDNLLDLSHLTYVHSSTTGNRDLAENAQLDTDVADSTVRMTRWMADVVPAPAYRDYGGYQGNVDRWQMTHFMAPSYIHVNNGSVDAGVGADRDVLNNKQGRWGFQVYHAMTPETETTTHQFWAVGTQLSMVPEDKRQLFADQMINVIKEDLDIYEAQQSAIDLDGETLARDVNPRGTLPGDDGLLAMRRILRRIYGDEQKSQRVAAH